jgi:hypothetical protein
MQHGLIGVDAELGDDERHALRGLSKRPSFVRWIGSTRWQVDPDFEPAGTRLSTLPRRLPVRAVGGSTLGLGRRSEAGGPRAQPRSIFPKSVRIFG